MPHLTTRRGAAWAIALLAVAFLPHAAPLAALVAPLDTTRTSLSRMVDARVNLKESFQRATAARPGALAAGAARTRAQSTTTAAAVAQLKLALPGLDVKVSGLTGAPTQVLNQRGALTGPAPGQSSEDIVRGFLSEHGDLYGLSAADLGDLVVLGDSPGGTSHLRMLRMEQQIDGRPVFQSETRFLLDRDGRLMKSVGVMVPQARALAPQVDPASLMTPEAAIVHLLEASGKTASPASFTVTSQDGPRTLLAETDDFVVGPVTARPVLFPLAPGVLVPAWSLVVFTEGDQDWYAVVDAQTGDLLWRKNIRNYASAQDARFRVYVQADGVTPADSPAPQSPNTVVPGAGTQFTEIAPTIVSMHTAYDPVASPNGWIDDCPAGGCTANETQTLGNNALACLDRTGGADANICDTDANSVLDGNGRPTGNPDANSRNRDFLGTAPRDFQTNFLPPPQAGNPEAGQTATGNGVPQTIFRRGVVTHLFYVANWYHDRLFELGFDEAAGNFQQTNFSGMGVGGDRVLADAQDNSSTNNANFATPPDGTSGRAQMYRFTGPTIDRDGDLDQEVLMHELTHGTSNRLVGNAAGLNWDPAGGMGEGWSDFVALSLLNNTAADNPDARYASGAYATYKLQAGYLDNYVYGIRRFPYTTDHSVNPMTWADVDDVTNDLSGGIAPSPVNFNGNGGMEVHNSGEIWALTLWGVRSRIINDPAGANGNVPTGNHTSLQLIIDGLKMTPIDPSFTDARDAILQADCATNACANETSIWGGFADRGLGYGALTPYNVMVAFASSHMAIHESFSLPFLDVPHPATDVAINDSAGNSNGAIDPGEAIQLTVTLTNPWRAASKAVTGATATLTTSTPGITILDNTSTYGAIAPQGTAAGDSFLIVVDPSVACGSAIDFTLTTVSNLGTTSTTFRLRMGAASGTDPVVTYTDTVTPPLAIPDGQPRGVSRQMTITDDFEIADLDFRIDSITHGFDGDLSIMLRSPGGVGVDLISLIAVTDPGGFGSTGHNLTNMVINDDLAVTAANDMGEATSAQAPYTGSWLPIFNSPWTTLFGFPNPDPVGNLSRYDGTSTKGTWTIRPSDYSTPDAGSLSGWSLLVTPVHFACTAFSPPDLAITKTDGVTSATPGGSVTYTITASNAGPSDANGATVADTFPASLTCTWTCVGAGGGTCTASGSGNLNDTVNLPNGGSVTYTASCTISASATGTLSNTATVATPTGVTDPTPGNNSATDNDTLAAQADLSITKTDGVTTVPPGGSTIYTITASNAGPSNASGATVADTFPASLTCTWTCVGAGGGTCTASGSGNLNDVVNLPSGGSVTYTASCTISTSATGTVDNTATVTAPAGVTDPTPGNNSATDSDTVLTGVYFTLVPCRLLDTRNATGPYGGPALNALSTRTFVAAGQCGIPASATSLFYNICVTQPTAGGDLRIYPTGVAAPLTSALNYSAGQTRCNNGIVNLGAAGDFVVKSDQPTGNTQLIMDVFGYFQ